MLFTPMYWNLGKIWTQAYKVCADGIISTFSSQTWQNHNGFQKNGKLYSQAADYFTLNLLCHSWRQSQCFVTVANESLWLTLGWISLNSSDHASKHEYKHSFVRQMFSKCWIFHPADQVLLNRVKTTLPLRRWVVAQHPPEHRSHSTECSLSYRRCSCRTDCHPPTHTCTPTSDTCSRWFHFYIRTKRSAENLHHHRLLLKEIGWPHRSLRKNSLKWKANCSH